MRSMRLPSFGVVGVLVVGASLAGCNSKGLVPVEGRITFAGKEPASLGYLYFVPREFSTDKLDDRTGPHPGSAIFDVDGAYRATTFSDGDGLRPGTYEVRITCDKRPAADPGHHHDTPVTSLVPKAFRPPDLVVPTSGPRPVRYDLDVK
jgi:hypothetical protein